MAAHRGVRAARQLPARVHGRYRGDTGEIQGRYRGDIRGLPARVHEGGEGDLIGEIQRRYRGDIRGLPSRVHEGGEVGDPLAAHAAHERRLRAQG